MNIKKNVETIQNEIKSACATVKRNPTDVTVIGVTKYVDAIVAEALLANGISHLGENRPDVFLEKYHAIGTAVTWHFIGSLQTRKVKDVINHIDYLHALDRLSLAQEINKRATQQVKCFVQVNTSGEERKHGLEKSEVIDFIKALTAYPKIEVVGLMTMAPDTKDASRIRSCFQLLKQLQQEIQKLALGDAPCKFLSMGMTNDYQIAIAEGATFVRLGRCLVEE